MKRVFFVIALVSVFAMPSVVEASGSSTSAPAAPASCSHDQGQRAFKSCVAKQSLLCTHGGYRRYTTSRGASFKSERDCVKYVKAGCRLVPKRPPVCPYDPSLSASDSRCVEPPAVDPTLTLVDTVYDTCTAAGTRCQLGIDGAGLQPGSTVSVYEPNVCCSITFLVGTDGTVSAHGILSCGGVASRENTFVAEGIGADGSVIITDPVVLPIGVRC